MKNVLTVILFLFSVSLVAQNYKKVKIDLKSFEDVKTLLSMGMEFDHYSAEKDNSIITFLSDNDFEKLQTTGFGYEVLIDNWHEYYKKLPQLTPSEKENFILESKDKYGVEGLTFGSMGGFYTLSELLARLDSMSANYPQIITQKFSIGTSHEGRDIWALKISDNPNVNEDEPQVLFDALIHAREPASMATIIYYMYYLLENYGTDDEVTYLINNREIYFIPCFNPDGYEYNRVNDPNGGGMWRKNRLNSGGGDYGVDLNRNFSYKWGYDNSGSSGTPSSNTYRGPSAFSEPESQAFRDFVISKNFKTHINYHSYSDIIIYPWGYMDALTPDSVEYNIFSADMSKWNNYEYGTGYSTIGYLSNGTLKDWSYGEQTTKNKIFGYVFEVGSSSDGFWPNQNRIFPLVQANLRPNLYNTWVAGGYANVIGSAKNTEYINPGDTVKIKPVLQNKGLENAENLSVEISSSDPNISIISNSASVPSIASFGIDSSSVPVTFLVSNSAAIGSDIELIWTVFSNSVKMSVDTFSIRIGTPLHLFSDNNNDPSVLWNSAGTPSGQSWQATELQFYSAPNSYTESKNGNYVSSSDLSLTTINSIDLTGATSPVLAFRTKFNIEDKWDCGRVLISTNNGSSWTALAGNHTNPGSGQGTQGSGEPVYDGSISNWVLEEIDLGAYEGEQILIRFQFKSDGSIEKDGWNIDDINIYYYGAVPVELVSFSANVEGEAVTLNWKTATELNNLGFEIERISSSKTKSGTVKIGFVEGKGTTTDLSNYTFIDENPIPGKISYRLKQIDFDGTTNIIGTKEVNFAAPINYSLEQNYPNPFNPSTIIKYSIKNAERVELKLFNIMGQQVAVLLDEQKEAGNYEFNFDTVNFAANISSGVYFYSITAGKFRSVKKMIVLK